VGAVKRDQGYEHTTMEVRGNDQHRAELRELSKLLGGYAIVIDNEIPEDEIHVIEKLNGGLPAKQVIYLEGFEYDQCA
jgi:hypothetical protein